MKEIGEAAYVLGVKIFMGSFLANLWILTRGVHKDGPECFNMSKENPFVEIKGTIVHSIPKKD